MKQQFLSVTLYFTTSLLGLAAFLYPFWLPAVAQASGIGVAHGQDAPLFLTLLVGLCFLVLLLEVQGAGMSAKTVALLGMLVSLNAVLRFAEAAVPIPGGFSPIFLLIILGGYVFGARFGFLMGVLTLLVSALLTGGAGPWLPFQMFAAGWMGMSAALCRLPVRLLRAEGRWTEIVILAGFGGLWGLLFGLIMNIWFWPYLVAPSAALGDQYWSPGMAVLETLKRYAAFYLVTSLVWDLMRLAGNAILMVVFGPPILRILRRFYRRFTFEYRPAALGFVATAEDGLARTAPAAQLELSAIASHRPESASERIPFWKEKL